MKLKYKKIVLVVTTFTMLIGCMIFSTVSPTGDSNENNQTEEVSGEQTEKKDVKEGEEVSNEDGSKVKETENVAKEQETEEPQKAQETQEPQETPTQGITLEKSTNQQINQLVTDYFDASVACDMEKLGTLLNDVSTLNKDELKLKYEFVDGIKNVECYLAKGLPENKYLVYVYSEVKFKDVTTMAPGLSRLNIVKTEEGNYQIFFGADSEMEQFAKEADTSEAVQKLVEKVGLKMEEALSSDAELKELNEKMTVTNTKEEKKETKEETEEETIQETTE